MTFYKLSDSAPKTNKYINNISYMSCVEWRKASKLEHLVPTSERRKTAESGHTAKDRSREKTGQRLNGKDAPGTVEHITIGDLKAVVLPPPAQGIMADLSRQ